MSHVSFDTGLYHNTSSWNKKDISLFGFELADRLPLIPLTGTLGAQSGEFQIVADDFKDGGAVEIILQFVEWCDGCIVNTATADAADMVMFFGNPVVVFHGAGELQALDFTEFAKHIEVSINGAQTDAGQSFSHPLVNFIGGRVVVESADFFQDNPPLWGHSRFFIEFHAHDLRKKV